MTASAENLKTVLPKPFSSQVNMYILAMGKRLSPTEKLRLEQLKNGRAFTGKITPEEIVQLCDKLSMSDTRSRRKFEKKQKKKN